MKELVWAISVEYMVDDGYGSFFSLFRNYDDALAAFQRQIAEETEWIGADSYTEEDKDENGAIWWLIKDAKDCRYSAVALRQKVVQ